MTQKHTQSTLPLDKLIGLGKTMDSALWPLIVFTLMLFADPAQPAKRTVDRSLILEIDEIKAFKKIQRTHKNLLVLFAKSEGSAAKKLDLLAEASQEVKGKGTIAFVNCGNSKKLCKKLKASPSPVVLKHYKDGEFNKDYDRQDTLKSLLNFMKDPTGDAPWEEEPAAADVRHIHTSQEFEKLVKKEKKPLLVMFYAPWCGYCKRLEPEYAAAASELKGEAVMAGMDVDTEQGYPVRIKFNITGFPTIIYFENGAEKYKYNSGHTKDDLVSWMRNPEPPKEPEKEEEWSDVPSDVVHLTDASFDEFMEKNPSVLVMFYAPWCGHCKAMKPEYTEAAKTLKEENVEGVLAAIDATKETALGKRFEVQGYPTVKYFKDGQEAFTVNERKADAIVSFMKDPKEPPPPPPPEKDWSEVESDVHHLTAETFKGFTKKKKHVLIMFYAPWCGHCKKAKPEFMEAAKHYVDNTKVAYAAVDCTVHDKLCGQYDVTGYPTLRYFNYGKKDFKYKGGREAKDFIAFMADPKEGPPPPPAEPKWSDEPSFVHFLTKNSFDSFVKSQESALIMFYAPWCGHCKAMKPAYMEAAEELIEKTSDHALAAVDCTKEREIAERFSVRGYPTIKYFRNGEFVSDYNGGRTKEELVNFILNPELAEPAKPAEPDEPTEPAKPVEPETRSPAESQWSDDVIHLTKDTFPEFLQSHPSALIMFYAPWCPHCQDMKPTFGEVAKHVNTDKKGAGAVAAVDCTAEKTLCTDNEVKGYPTLNYFKDGKFDFKYKGPRTAEKIISFLQNPQKPDTSPPPDWSTEPSEVEFLKDKTFDDFIRDNPSVMVFFYSPRCGFCQKMKPNYFEAADILIEERPDVILAAVDCYRNKALNKRFITEGYPTVKYFRNGEEEKEYDGDRSTADIVKFINTVDPAPAPEPEVPDEEDQEPEEPESTETGDAVIPLVQSSFEGFINEKEHVLVMFAAPWCGHCQDAKPKFAEAAEALKDDHSRVFATVDCTVHGDLCNQHNVNGFPTFRYYTFGKFVEEYDGSRSTDDFLAFMSAPPKPAPPEKADRKPSDGSRDEL